MKKYFLNLVVGTVILLPGSVFAMEEVQEEATGVHSKLSAEQTTKTEMFHDALCKYDCEKRDLILHLCGFKVQDLGRYSCASKATNAYVYQWYRAVEAEHTTPSIWTIPSLWERSFSIVKDYVHYMQKCAVHKGHCPSVTLIDEKCKRQNFIASDLPLTDFCDQIDVLKIVVQHELGLGFLRGFVFRSFSKNPLLKIQFFADGDNCRPCPSVTKFQIEEYKSQYGDQVSFEGFELFEKNDFDF